MAQDNNYSDTALEANSGDNDAADAREIDTPDGNIIEITIATSVWQQEIVDEFADFAAHSLDFMQDFFDLPALSVSILLDNDARIRQINRDFRNQDKATNVLSFPAAMDDDEDDGDGDDLLFLGDIAIAFETVDGEAHAAEIDFLHHLSHLFVHGVMHLLGYDHETSDEADEMEALEIAVLGAFSIPDPYADSVPVTAVSAMSDDR